MKMKEQKLKMEFTKTQSTMRELLTQFYSTLEEIERANLPFESPEDFANSITPDNVEDLYYELVAEYYNLSFS